MPLRSRLGSAAAGPRRGLEGDDPKIMPVAQALVMGLGGSGIQTVSRVKSMIDSSFPEAAATSSVAFLGVDAVDLTKQNPPLPPGVTLAPSDFFNLTEGTFDASAIVRSESTHDSPLLRWWDHTRRVPAGVQTSGLKQDRMLGRLAYYKVGDRLAGRITAGLRTAATITGDSVGLGLGGGADGGVRPKVYLAASMCGGTGSSGVLETLYRIWSAASGMGLTPEITLFLYMPGIFENEARRTSPNPMAEVANLRANAYGFLRELDHFITHSDQLVQNLAKPGLGAKAAIPAGDLVRQVFLIDTQLSGGQFLDKIGDAYEVAASAIYQLLMTRVGQEVAVNGVNMDQLLQENDGHGKRRIYCGLGVSAVTYPGETLRQHVSHRFADWFVRDRLLSSPDDLSERVRKDPRTTALFDRVKELHGDAVSFERADKVRQYGRVCSAAPETLSADSSEDTVVRIVTAATQTRATAVSELNTQLEVYAHSAIAKLEDRVVASLLERGESLPFMSQTVKHVAAQLAGLRTEAEARAARHQDAIRRGEDEIDEASRVLRDVQGWRAWLGGRDTAAKALGAAIQAYGKASLDAQYAQSSARFYTEAIAVLNRLQAELDRAAARLNAEVQRFSDAWHADELLGKDAGPRDLTALIPADIQPEVEDSALARDSYKRMKETVDKIDATSMLAAFYRAWRGEDDHRAVFDLGSTSKDRTASARKAFLGEVERLADEHALQADIQDETPDGVSNLHRLYLPRSLEDAAARVDDGRSLRTALVSMGALAGQVLLPVDSNKLRSDVALSPSTLVSRPASLADEVARHLPDTTGCRAYDWPDQERLQTITTVWGASAHSLAAVATWRGYYDRALELDTEGARRPPHLSRTWVDELDPLEPDYNDLELAAGAVTWALLVGDLLEDDAAREALFGSRAPRASVGVPLRAEDQGARVAWHGALFVQDPETRRWRVRGQQFDFGSTVRDLLGSVASNPLFRQNIAEFGAAVVLAVGRDVAIVRLRALADRFGAAVDRSTNPAEGRATDLLRHEAQELLAQMEHTAAVAGF